MFDVGFSEMMVIAVVALVVIGPERLPRVARTLGFWFGRLQRYVNDVKADINREVELEDLRKFKSQFEEAASGVENEIRSEVAKAESTFTAVGTDASAAANLSPDASAPTAATAGETTAGGVAAGESVPAIPPAASAPAETGQKTPV